MVDFVQFGTASGFGLPTLAGADSGVLRFGALEQDQGLLLTPNTGGPITNWTLALDIFIPAGGGAFTSLLQTDVTNTSDGDLFIRALNVTTGGIGIASVYPGGFDFGSWERVVVTAESIEGGTLLSKYVDGALIGTQNLTGTRWTIDGANGVLLLTDEDGETNAGALSSVMFADRALTATEVAALGTVDADGIAAVAPSANASQFDFSGGSYVATYGAGTLAAPGDTDPLPEPELAVVNRVSDIMKTPGSTVVIDLADVFNRDDITITVENDDESVVTEATLVGETLTLELGALGHADLRITATDGDGNSVVDNLRVRVAGPNAYTIAVLPDTQDYTDASLTNGPPQTFYNMTQWLVDNKESHNIVFVAHVGDITQNNLASEWVVANTALSKLDGVIPYSVLPGNHDQAVGGSAADHTSGVDTVFSPERQAASNPGTFGGVYDREPDRAVNNYHTFTAPDGTKWLVLSMEFGPRDDVIRWAGDVIEGHLDHRVVVVSHALTDYAGRHDPAGGPLYDEGAGYDYGIGRDPEGANDGETVYRELLAAYPNITFTFSGHIFGDGAETNVSYSQYGNAIVESLVNYQNGVSREVTGNGDASLGGRGGNGAMRLVTIDPDNGRITTETYFTEFDDYLDGFRTKEELDRDGLTGPYRGHEEVFTDIDVGTPTLQALSRAGDDVFATAAPGRDTAKVTLDGSGSLDPASDTLRRIWHDQDGRAIAAGESPEATLVAGRHYLTLAVTDAAGQVTTDDKLVIVSDNSTRLVETFNDGDMDGWGRPGASLTPLAVGTPESFGLPALPGGADSVVHITPFTPGEGLLLQPNLGVPANTKIPTWSIVFDILVPAGQGTFTSFLQLNTSNGDDGDLFIRNRGNGTGGIGISGDYEGDFVYGAWQRVAFTFTPNGTDTLLLSKYINGTKVGDQTVSAERFSLDINKGALLFSDEDGETGNLYVSSILLTEKVFTDAEITDLGGAKAGGIVATAPTPLSVQFDFNDASLAPTFGVSALSYGTIGSGAGGFMLKGTVFAPGTAVAGDPAPEGRLFEQSDAADSVLTWNDADAMAWSDYTLALTIRSTDNDAIGVTFYWQDADNHYRLVLNGETNTRSLVRVAEGVETVLASEVGGTRFNVDQELSVSIVDGTIMAFLDGQLLFGGAVVDANPLEGGTVGLYSSEQRSSQFDNITVNDVKLAAFAGADRRVADIDGDGEATVMLEGAGSFGPRAIASWQWADATGTVLATTRDATVDLAAGRHELTLTVTDTNGAVSTDKVQVEVVGQGRVLLAEDFSGAGLPAGWTIVDEGEFGGVGADSTESDWSVTDGRLVQNSDLQSRQLEWNGASNPNVWLNGWSPLGDGVNVLRLGTYALYTGEGASTWTDYSIEATIETPDNDGLGFLFHYVDASNYYKLELDAEGTYDRNPSNGAGPTFNLIRMRGGVEEILGQVPQRYTPGESFHLRVDIQDQKITGWIDGDGIFAYEIEDRSHTQGTVGLYSWGSAGVSFDDVRVIALDDAGPFALPTFGITSAGQTVQQVAVLNQAAQPGVVYQAIAGRTATELHGTASGDRVIGRGGDDLLHGAGGTDYVYGGVGADTLTGGADNDTLLGSAGDDVLAGGVGNDQLLGGIGNDLLRGEIGDDLLNGGDGADTLEGGAGNDRYIIRDSADVVVEQAGGGYDVVVASVNLTLSADVEELRLTTGATAGTGNELANRLFGTSAGDLLQGMGGNDELRGNGGNDTLVGGEGADRLVGGAGADVFRFNTAAEAGDRVIGYNALEDTIEVSASGFGGGLVIGMDVTTTGHYREALNNAATSEAGMGQFIFETDGQRLWWDADGAGGAAAELIAALPLVQGWVGTEITIIA